VRGFVAGLRIQLAFYRSSPDSALPLLTGPIFTIIFSMILRHGGRADLTGYAVLAPFYMSLWWFALFSGGLIIQGERREGTVDYLLAAPVGFVSVILGRISTLVLAGLVAFVEMWVFGRYVLRAQVSIYHPALFAVSLVLTLFAMTTTSLLMANAFVLSRSAMTYTNAASYPIYLLGGILVPVAFLPGWLQPVTDVVFLSWSSRLLRASIAAGPSNNTGFDLVMLLALGVIAAVLAWALMIRILRKVRETGELALQ
jgi:ABC-2 type transport system permease protein